MSFNYKSIDELLKYANELIKLKEDDYIPALDNSDKIEVNVYMYNTQEKQFDNQFGKLLTITTKLKNGKIKYKNKTYQMLMNRQYNFPYIVVPY